MYKTFAVDKILDNGVIGYGVIATTVEQAITLVQMNSSDVELLDYIETDHVKRDSLIRMFDSKWYVTVIV